MLVAMPMLWVAMFLTVGTANAIQFSLADKGVSKLNVVTQIRKNRNNF